MSKHTPGPWAVSSTERRYVREVNGKRYVASCTDSQDYRTYEEAEANARLIACAPEMLEALQDLCDTLGECGMTEKARAAIARAEGEKT